MAQKITPMMAQYQEIKRKHPDAYLFFRLGDFYELFGEEAKEVSRLLNLTLTARNGTPMCGVPFHAASGYINRLNRLGKKVAICEQISDPSLPGIVERDVIRVVTPGTTFDDKVVDSRANHFIAAVFQGNMKMGVAICDVTTGEFNVSEINTLDELREEIFKLKPAECIVLPQSMERSEIMSSLGSFENMPIFPHEISDNPYNILISHFNVKSLDGFGIEDKKESISAAGMLLDYLKITQKTQLQHIKFLKWHARGDGMFLDESTIRNLELVSTMRDGTREGSLLWVMDKTITSMGGRMLRSWILKPLSEKEKIEEKLDAISEMIENHSASNGMRETLKTVLDIERLLGKIGIGTGSGRDIAGIRQSLAAYDHCRVLIVSYHASILANLGCALEKLRALNELKNLLETALTEAPPLGTREGGMIKEGYCEELDVLRSTSREGKKRIQEIQQKAIEETGIQSLKVKYNQVFGYFIEVTKSNLHRVPETYIRKQTMTNAERYITPELKEYEETVLGAEEKIKSLEYRLFCELRDSVISFMPKLQEFAKVLSTLDALLSLAEAARQNNYVRPEIISSCNAKVTEVGVKDCGIYPELAEGPPQGGARNDNTDGMEIKNGRNPVIEKMSLTESFVANDCELSETSRVMLITGPNMGGKSTYLRQVALIVLMAHVGSFVPAENAKIALVDRIFTRVGASDNLIKGQSTFMVEMQEASNILHHATERSLIILDEIGRGTSTYDGVSLAWAIVEYIHDVIGAKTLFATHYHELINVIEKLSRAKNYSVGVKEGARGIVFLYKVMEGAVDRSYGIEVAKLAGLPKEVVGRANQILHDLEEGIVDRGIQATLKSRPDESQLGLWEAAQERKHRAVEELEKIDLNSMTPLEALKKLDELKKLR